jgi:hypothetical protein
MLISASLPPRRRVRGFLLGVLSSLLLAGYLRFDGEHPAWGRLLVVLTLAVFGYGIARLAARANAHYVARPWDLPIDQSRIWTEQQERSREVLTRGKHRYVLNGTLKVAPPIAMTFFGILILLPGLPNLQRTGGIPEFAIWLVVAVMLAVPPAVYLMRRGWRRTEAAQRRSAPGRTT